MLCQQRRSTATTRDPLPLPLLGCFERAALPPLPSLPPHTPTCLGIFCSTVLLSSCSPRYLDLLTSILLLYLRSSQPQRKLCFFADFGGISCGVAFVPLFFSGALFFLFLFGLFVCLNSGDMAYTFKTTQLGTKAKAKAKQKNKNNNKNKAQWQGKIKEWEKKRKKKN